jgi:hypothetical protein
MPIMALQVRLMYRTLNKARSDEKESSSLKMMGSKMLPYDSMRS